uniref:Uncharacterized protein n=1 Tax=Percolomonas cosmopolitus TaxID=63605 RepID=A0A7S1KTZ9_9EUKA|mmetsp:Transcript_8359/g.30911  ORF Transcript_8359/g.30911 Transcript_8359/m.30911 type:complete len:690 (+) Transcript_8359:214-2283(+)
MPSKGKSPSPLTISKAPTSEKVSKPSASSRAPTSSASGTKQKSAKSLRVNSNTSKAAENSETPTTATSNVSNGGTEELNALRKQVAELKTLNQTYVYQISSLENQHGKELENLKNELVTQRRANKEMEKKVSRVDEVESAIIKLYLEMKDRSTEVTEDNYEQLRMIEEQKHIQKLKSENPLIVLDKLKATLRNLISFKEDYENELKDQIHRKMTDAEVKLKETKQRCRQLETEKEEYKINAARAIQEKNEALESKREIIDESNIRMRRLQKDNERLIDEIKKGEQIINDLNQKLDNRDKILRHREIQLMRITQLESQIQKTKLKHQFDQNKVKSEMFKSRQSYERQLSHFNKIKAEKKDLEDALQKMAAKVQSLMKDANRTRVIDLEKKEDVQMRSLEKLEKENVDYKQDNKKMKIQIENLKKDNKKMKEEYEKIFMAALNEKKKKQTDHQRAVKQEIVLHARENAQKSPHITEYYKKRLKEKEKEVEELTKRVRRMILSEHRGSIMEKNFELERTRLQSEVKTLKKMFVPKDSALQFKHQYSKHSAAELRMRNQELEERLRDYENLKAANVTQTQAYNRLQQRQQSMMNQMMDLGGMQNGDNVDDTLSNISDGLDSPNSPAGVGVNRGRSVWGSGAHTPKARRASFGGGSARQRPQSAGSSRTRPVSASGKKIRLGSTYSSVKVGSLL